MSVGSLAQAWCGSCLQALYDAASNKGRHFNRGRRASGLGSSNPISQLKLDPLALLLPALSCHFGDGTWQRKNVCCVSFWQNQNDQKERKDWTGGPIVEKGHWYCTRTVIF